mmetsp:Transcript_1921/g.5622  ORF Transcript_1921/g.5622 Transcript_1921/m.5622 type:complete len:202 (+) Transcript_1921:3925-4530(+)
MPAEALTPPSSRMTIPSRAASTQRSCCWPCRNPGSPKTKIAARPLSSTVTCRTEPPVASTTSSISLPRTIWTCCTYSSPMGLSSSSATKKRMLTLRFSASISISVPSRQRFPTKVGMKLNRASKPYVFFRAKDIRNLLVEEACSPLILLRPPLVDMEKSRLPLSPNARDCGATLLLYCRHSDGNCHTVFFGVASRLQLVAP